MSKAAEILPLPGRINTTLAAAFVGLNIFSSFVLPGLIAAGPAWRWAVLPLVLSSNSFWFVIHESIHSNLHPSKEINEIWGRALCWFYGAPWRLLRFGHLTHHRMNRSSIDRPEVYDVKSRGWWKAAPGFYFNLLGGLYAAEISCCFLFFLPGTAALKLLERHWSNLDEKAPSTVYLTVKRELFSSENLKQCRIDSAASLLVLGASALLYRHSLLSFAALIFGRACLVSITDNLPHYGTSLSDVRYGRDLRLPPLMAWIFLNFNFHGVHHENPALPWIYLRRLFVSEGRQYAESYWAAALRQFRGPVEKNELEPPHQIS